MVSCSGGAIEGGGDGGGGDSKGDRLSVITARGECWGMGWGSGEPGGRLLEG